MMSEFEQGVLARLDRIAEAVESGNRLSYELYFELDKWRSIYKPHPIMDRHELSCESEDGDAPSQVHIEAYKERMPEHWKYTERAVHDLFWDEEGNRR